MWKLPFNLHVKYEAKLTTLPSSPIVKCDGQVTDIYAHYVYKHCSKFIHASIHSSKTARGEIDRGHFAYVKTCLLTTHWSIYTAPVTWLTNMEILVLLSMCSTPLSRNEWKFQNIAGVQRKTYRIDFKWKFCVARDYKFTHFYRERIFLSKPSWKKTWKNRVL